ncbi:MAG TPA: RNA polymerase sigma factor [Acidimicrobiales bacterium]|nr:RNA polymerase sigma factor [Acidimicrobiales bacterium]
MSSSPAVVPNRGPELLALYDHALPEVYGYLLRRCSDSPTAEDLTAETFLAAAAMVRNGKEADLNVPWLIGVARHKLVDHWRRQERQQRNLVLISTDTEVDDPWDATLDAMRAQEVLAELGPHHQSALTLRYLDGLSVPDTAAALNRTVHATEALLVRAKRAYRNAYERSEGDE